MAVKESIELEDEDFDSDDTSPQEAEPSLEVAKTNLAKRRVVDNLLEERRLKKQLDDYDYDF